MNGRAAEDAESPAVGVARRRRGAVGGGGIWGGCEDGIETGCVFGEGNGGVGVGLVVSGGLSVGRFLTGW